jgi:hypothetical protein
LVDAPHGSTAAPKEIRRGFLRAAAFDSVKGTSLC